MASELEKALKTIMAPGFGESEAKVPQKPKGPWVAPFDATELAQQLRSIAHVSWRLAMMATRAQDGKREFDRMAHPVPGDLVVEMSTINNPKRALEAVGTLLREVREPVLDEDGTQKEDWDERVGYLTNLDGVEMRWTNYQFVALPNWGAAE